MAQHPLMSYVHTQEDYCLALKKLESQSAITLSDSCISFVLCSHNSKIHWAITHLLNRESQV